jgi:hypothetical protein
MKRTWDHSEVLKQVEAIPYHKPSTGHEKRALLVLLVQYYLVTKFHNAAVQNSSSSSSSSTPTSPLHAMCPVEEITSFVNHKSQPQIQQQHQQQQHQQLNQQQRRLEIHDW